MVLVNSLNIVKTKMIEGCDEIAEEGQASLLSSRNVEPEGGDGWRSVEIPFWLGI